MATEKRLISAWDLLEWIDNIDTENHLRLLRGKKAKWLNTEGVRHMINTVPIVDAEEVVHGEWDVIEDDYLSITTLKCSVCGEEWAFEDYDGLLPQSQTYHYCPNCGAKMDGGADSA